MNEAAVATSQRVAQVFDLHALKEFASDKRVRKMLFKTDQLWSEIACYEPGQSTVMHHHPGEEEAIFVLEGRASATIYSEKGRAVAYRDIEAGDIFGELSAIDGRARSARPCSSVRTSRHRCSSSATRTT